MGKRLHSGSKQPDLKGCFAYVQRYQVEMKRLFKELLAPKKTAKETFFAVSTTK